MSRLPAGGRLPPAEVAAAPPGPPASDPLARGPQWGEAYLLFDGAFLSLDDLLRSADEGVG